MVKRLTSRPPQRDTATTLPLVTAEVANAHLDRCLNLLLEKCRSASSLLSSMPSNSADFVDANSRILKFTIDFQKAANALASKIPSADGPNMQMLTASIQTLLTGIDTDSLFLMTDHRATGEIRSSSLSKRNSDSASLISSVMVIVSPLFDSFSVEKPL